MKIRTFISCAATALIILTAAQSVDAEDYLVAHKSNLGAKVEFEVKYNDLDKTILTYEVDGYYTSPVRIENREYRLLSLHPAAYMDFDQAGHPMIPELSASLMIPDTARMEVSVKDSEWYEIPDFDLAPWRGNILRSVDPAAVPYTFGEAYGQDAWFPGEIAHLRDPFVLRDVRGITVEVHPFQYNPVQRALRVYTRVEIEVKHAGEGSVNTIDRSTYGYKPDREFENLYKGHFHNYESNRGTRGLPD
ncbi:MAG: C25 family peptidase propeptide domain-containing protein [Planctomycetota bacterium]|jgi:hypothetical protein